jgi:PAS domain S-box-containing protein
VTSSLKSCHRPPRVELFHSRGCRIILLALFFLWPFELAAAEGTPNPKVVILNSYHPGYAWSDEEVAGVIQELRRSYPDIDPAIEYLDSKRFPSNEDFLRVKDSLARKYHRHKFDLVIALDNAALELVLAHRTELFPGVPVVFTGVNDFSPAMLAGHKKVNGDAEILDIEGTLKTALALHPETTEIFVVADYTLNGKAQRNDIEAILPHLPAAVHVKFAPPATMAELVGHIKKLPATAIMLIATFATDKVGQTFLMAESTRRLTEYAKVPVYIVHEERLGNGAVGGMLLGGRQEGRRAGEIALQVLAGEDPSNIPVDTKGNARPMFDYRQLARFKIPLDALPAGSIIINRPSSLYEVHKSLVWGISGVALFLGGVVVVLGVTINRRRRAEKKLEHQFSFLQKLLDTLPNPVFYKDTKGVYLGCNKTLEEFLGVRKEGIVGKTVFDSYPKDLADRYFAMDQELFNHPGIQVYESEMERRDGVRRKFIFTKATFLNANGSLGGLIGVMTDITERKAVEEALRITRENLELAIKGADLGTWDWNIKTGALTCNDRYMEMLGYRPDEVQPHLRAWEKLVHPEDLPAVMAVLNAHLDRKTPLFETEYRLRHKSGEWVWVLDRGKVIARDAEGQPMRACGTHLDITARKQAEEELQFRNVLLSTQQEVSIDGILVVDEEARILSYNRRFIEMWGLPTKLVEDKVDEPVLHFVAAQLVDSRAFLQWVQHLYKHKKETSRDELLLADGRVFDRYSAPMFGAEERYYGRVWYFRDITERKKAEAALRESEERNKTIIRTAMDGFWLTDLQGRLLEVNDAYCKMSGYSSAELAGMSISDLEATETPADTAAHMQTIMALGEERFETLHRRKDGSIITVEASVQYKPVEGDRMVAFLRDITERKQAEEKIIRQREELRGLASRLAEVEEAERQDLARELHDQVCQNLTVLSLNLAIIKGRAPQEPLERLLSRVASLAAVVEQTNEITRNIMEGLRPTVLDHYGLMGGLRQFGNKFFQQTGITVDIKGEESAPRLAAPVELALFRITQEALGNVAKHSRASQVTVDHEEQDDTFRLTIADNGIGFDPDKVGQPTAGHKWGLMTMAERALAIGGHCQVESGPGQGTRVVVEVPR